jgi:hypothetical protein
MFYYYLSFPFFNTKFLIFMFSFFLKGSILICDATPGRSTPNGNGNTTKATLAAMRPPCHSVVLTNGSGWHMLFHPDQVLVKYIVDFGNDNDGQTAAERAAAQAAAQAAILRKQKFEALQAQRALKVQLQKDKLIKCQGRQAMVDHFVKRCDALLENLSESNVILRERLFFLELQQFDHQLPMYSRKAEFVDSLNTNQALVLKGGTGIGKTVTVPQWVYDHVFCEAEEKFSKARVAVLVPRKAIAIGLAGYISRVRKVKLGKEIGLGTGDGVNFNDDSRLVFMTYGFFQAITQSDPTFSKWSAVILDEAHERNPSADILLGRMAATCRQRKEFKAIIMSATIDVRQFAEAITGLYHNTFVFLFNNIIFFCYKDDFSLSLLNFF